MIVDNPVKEWHITATTTYYCEGLVIRGVPIFVDFMVNKKKRYTIHDEMQNVHIIILSQV